MIIVPVTCLIVSAGALAWQVGYCIIDLWRTLRELRRKPTVILDAPPVLGGMLHARWTIPEAFGSIRHISIHVRGTVSPGQKRRKFTVFEGGDELARFDYQAIAMPTERAGTIAWPIPMTIRPTLDLGYFHIRWTLCLAVHDARDHRREYVFTIPVFVLATAS
jgi:hypothetical protein